MKQSKYPFLCQKPMHHAVFEKCIALNIKVQKLLRAFETYIYLDFYTTPSTGNQFEIQE